MIMRRILNIDKKAGHSYALPPEFVKDARVALRTEGAAAAQSCACSTIRPRGV